LPHPDARRGGKSIGGRVMKISKVNIENYKCFQGKFTLELNPQVNILVGNNESGKSTILEAINLVLTSMLNVRYLKNELSPYLFNYQTVLDYVQSLSDADAQPQSPPSICIEVFFDSTEVARFEGNGNSEKANACGVSLKIEFDPEYQSEYEALIKAGELKAIPIEYYRVSWQSFAREAITARSIPIKSVLIDSASSRYQNGSDVYISRIIHADLEDSDKAAISQEYRKMKEMFGEAEAVKAINEKIKAKSKISDKALSIAVDLATHNSWQTTLMTYLDEIPFHQAGKGEQCIIKTNLALGHKKSQEASLILLEEPENHLSHTRLNQLLRNIENECVNKQVIISTHSSFVANKLGIEHLIFLSNQRSSSFKDLLKDTFGFFKKLPGYQTLRLLLCRKAVLVEGPSDELIFQKAYMEANKERLPIEDGVDVISVGLSFKRFLEIAKTVDQPVAVVTDNDGDYTNNITEKYREYDSVSCVSVFADNRNELRTLEPQFVDANKNKLSALCVTIKIDNNIYDTEDKIAEYMADHKTEWALHVFESNKGLVFPQYISDAVRWCNE
jgi:putative ATP-dependent endonuclease of OLD family